MKLAAFYSAN